MNKALKQKVQLESLSYMDVKFLSECVEMKRRYVRVKIYEHRQFLRIFQSANQRKILPFSHSVERLKQQKEIIAAFVRYASATRSWKHACRSYLEAL